MAIDLHHQLQRRAAIVRILRGNAVARQAELVDLLHREGFEATQSSVSRDLREIGVVKGADRYLLRQVVCIRHMAADLSQTDVRPKPKRQLFAGADTKSRLDWAH